MQNEPKSALSIECACGTDYLCSLESCPGETCLKAQELAIRFPGGKGCQDMHFVRESFICPSCSQNNTEKWFLSVNTRRHESWGRNDPSDQGVA